MNEFTTPEGGLPRFSRDKFLRFQIGGDRPDPVQIGAYVRGHWSVENSLHWSLDVSFHEDASRIRKDHGPENFALLRRIALVLLKNERTAKGGVPAKRLRAGWDPDYLLKVLATGISRNALEKG